MSSFRDNFHIDKIGTSLDIGVKLEEMLGTRTWDNITTAQRLAEHAYGGYGELGGVIDTLREREATMNMLGYNNLVSQLLPRYEHLYAASDAIRYVNPIIESLRATESIRDFMTSHDWVTQNTLTDFSKSIGLSNSIYSDIVSAGRYVNDIQSLSDTIANSSLGLKNYLGVLQSITAVYEVAENLFDYDEDDGFNLNIDDIDDEDFSKALSFVVETSTRSTNAEAWHENFKTYLSDFITSFDKKKVEEQIKKIWAIMKALSVFATHIGLGLAIYTAFRDTPLKDAPDQNAQIIINIFEGQAVNVTNVTLNIASGWYYEMECICGNTGEVKMGYAESEPFKVYEERFLADDEDYFTNDEESEDTSASGDS